MSSNSNTSTNWPRWLVACIKCFPKDKSNPLTHPNFSAVPYNSTRSGQRPLEMTSLPKNNANSSGWGSRPGTASSAYTANTRFPVKTGNVYGTPSDPDPRNRWSKTYLTPQQFTELLDNIHDTLSHVPYAICGIAALNIYGYVARKLNSVSILCPAYAKNNVRGWLLIKGYETYGDYFGVPVGHRGYGGEGATVYSVRVKYVSDEGFLRLERVHSTTSNAWVLGIVDQIDYSAMGFIEQVRKLEAIKSEGEGADKRAIAIAESRIRMAARDIFWCLDKAARTRYRLDPRSLSTLLGEECWFALTERFEHARTEMARAGIDVAAVLAKHRDRQALREHDAMLRQFGVKGKDVITQQPSPFEGMRSLTENKSMYSLKQDLESGIPEPPSPAFPKPRRTHSAEASVPPPTPTTPSKKDRFLAGLFPKRSNSAREQGQRKSGSRKSSKPAGTSSSFNLSRANSLRSVRKMFSSTPPPPRQSVDIPRTHSEWI